MAHRFADQDAFDAAAALIASTVLLKLSTAEEFINSVAPSYYRNYPDDSSLYFEWLQASQALVKMARQLFEDDDVCAHVLRQFAWYTKNYDGDGNLKPLHRRVFNGSRFHRVCELPTDRALECGLRAWKYMAMVKFGTAPMSSPHT